MGRQLPVQGTLREAENRARVRLAMVAVKMAMVEVLVEVVGKEKVQRARSSGLRWSPCCRRERSGITAGSIRAFAGHDASNATIDLFNEYRPATPLSLWLP